MWLIKCIILCRAPEVLQTWIGELHKYDKKCDCWSLGMFPYCFQLQTVFSSYSSFPRNIYLRTKGLGKYWFVNFSRENWQAFLAKTEGKNFSSICLFVISKISTCIFAHFLGNTYENQHIFTFAAYLHISLEIWMQISSVGAFVFLSFMKMCRVVKHYGMQNLFESKPARSQSERVRNVVLGTPARSDVTRNK